MERKNRSCEVIGSTGLFISYICGILMILFIVFKGTSATYEFIIFSTKYVIRPFDFSVMGVFLGLLLIPFGKWK